MQRQENTKYPSFPHLNFQNLQILSECIAICRACAKLCIEEGHKKTAILCTECADVCELAYKFKSFHSEFTHSVLDICATVCKKCSDECKKMPSKHCQECAEVCKRCMNACSHEHTLA